MNKGALLLGVVSLGVGGGYYAYDQGWFSKHKDEAAARAEDHHGENKPVLSDVKMLTVPDVIGLPEADAVAKAKAAGFSQSQIKISDKSCNASDDNMQPQGNACNQEPAPGQTVNDKIAEIEIVIEHDTLEGGAIGFANEWHRMPDLVGSSVADAQSLLESKGFTWDEFEVRKDGSCEADTVCSTQPGAGQRKSKHGPGLLHVSSR